ncbi:MAG TPA: hypothetical protein VFL15_10610 [Gammaproteobacteria bacterium]|nr:hypothetical protein [Gammaproteobacteria bacterium]
MTGKTVLTPEQYQSAAENYFKNQAAFQKGKTPEQMAAQRAQHWTEAYNHVQAVAATLKDVASSHPDPEKRSQANLAISRLEAATAAFGSASLNHGVVHSPDDAMQT